MYTDDPKPWEDLRNAIILSAVYDYKKLLRKRENLTLNYDKIAKRSEIFAKIGVLEKFFTSDYFLELTGVNGNLIIKHVQEVIKNEQKRSSRNR